MYIEVRFVFVLKFRRFKLAGCSSYYLHVSTYFKNFHYKLQIQDNMKKGSWSRSVKQWNERGTVEVGQGSLVLVTCN